MSDDNNRTFLATTTIEYVLEDDDSAEEIRTGELSDVSIGFDTPDSDEVVGFPTDRETEFTGSFEVDLELDEAESVVCPSCNTANAVLPTPWLDMFTDEPVSCVSCGYPLL